MPNMFTPRNPSTLALPGSPQRLALPAPTPFKTESTAKRVFRQAKTAIKADPVFRAERKLATGIADLYYDTKYSKVGRWTGKMAGKVASGVNKGIVRPLGALTRGKGLLGLLTVGAVGMMATGIMRGAMNASNDIVMERYMQDQRYSRNIMMNSRVGLSTGTQTMNRHGNLNGLALALHTGRHGRGY